MPIFILFKELTQVFNYPPLKTIKLMPQVSDKPVVFLTFANAAEQGYLSQLKKESALLRDLFLPLTRAGQIELVHEESLDAAEIAETRVSDHEIYYQNDFIFQKTLV